MDKRKLYRDIARIRQQIFALTACGGFVIIAAATLMTQGLDLFLAFRNSVIGLVAFGLFGFLWGKYYEMIIENPLIESYRRDAQQQVEALKGDRNKRVVMELSVDELRPGMISINAIYNQDRALLVREGARLTEKMIQTLKDNNISTIKIEGQVRDTSSDDF